jgi:polyhydroxyalkanoate synthesis repressor PhaR
MAEARVIKRYANRKLYDTQHSRYVTLDQISEMIRAGDEVKIVDNKTKEDLTSVTLAQIIFEEEKKQRSFMPLGAMRNIIQNGGEWFAEAQRRVTSVLPFKRGEDEVAPEEEEDDDEPSEDGAPRKRELVVLREFRHWVNEQQRALDEWQKRVDGKIRTTISGISPFGTLHKDVRALADRIAELEAKLQAMSDGDGRE